MKLDLWLATDQANRRPVSVDFIEVPRVGDIVAVANCEHFLHDTYWKVESIHWSTRERTPRVDCVPAFRDTRVSGYRSRSVMRRAMRSVPEGS